MLSKILKIFSRPVPDISLLTFSGIYLNPLELDPSLIRIGDIAHSLAGQNRFTGHSVVPYSVGQHSCMVCDLLVGTGLELDGLLHDASEFVLHDVHRELKYKTAFGKRYKKIEKRASKVLADVFLLNWPEPPEVKKADLIALATERRDLMNPNGEWEILKDVEPYSIPIMPWTPEKTKAEFLYRYAKYRRV